MHSPNIASGSPAIAEAFFTALGYSPNDPICFRAFTDQKHVGVVTKQLIGTVAECHAQLADWNAEGFGIFAVINQATGFKDSDVTAVKAVFAD